MKFFQFDGSRSNLYAFLLLHCSWNKFSVGIESILLYDEFQRKIFYKRGDWIIVDARGRFYQDLQYLSR